MKIIITESQYKKVIKSTIDEAVSYSVAKEYLKIERSPEAEERIKQVFTNLKSLPNARQLDKRGWRISFPYTNDSTENEIKDILEPYQFSVKDYRNNLAIDVKNNTEIALNKALNIVSKKEPKAKELMDRYASIKSRGIIDKEEGLMIVFSSAKYDIVGMTTGRNWEKDSCMDLIKGGNKGYVKLDLKEGTIICYLTNINDTNLEKPIGRMLIKPFLNLENSEDVILYPDFKTYGNIPNSEKFIDNIDGYMEKTQKLSGRYRRFGCLYQDSIRDEIESKETIRTRALKKLENGENLTDSEFLSLPLINKRKLIDNKIIYTGKLNKTHYSFASQSQKKRYILLLMKNERISSFHSRGEELDWYIFKGAPKDMRKKIVDFKLKNSITLLKEELELATPEQREKYIDIIINSKRTLRKYEFEMATPEQIKEYIDKSISNNKYLTHGDALFADEFMAATPYQKEKYIDMLIYTKMRLNEFELNLNRMSQDLIKKYIDGLIKNEVSLRDYELKATTQEQKETYFETKLNTLEFLIDTLPKNSRNRKDSIKSQIQKSDLQGHELKHLNPVQKKRYMEIISKFN